MDASNYRELPESEEAKHTRGSKRDYQKCTQFLYLRVYQSWLDEIECFETTKIIVFDKPMHHVALMNAKAFHQHNYASG